MPQVAIPVASISALVVKPPERACNIAATSTETKTSAAAATADIPATSISAIGYEPLMLAQKKRMVPSEHPPPSRRTNFGLLKCAETSSAYDTARERAAEDLLFKDPEEKIGSSNVGIDNDPVVNHSKKSSAHLTLQLLPCLVMCAQIITTCRVKLNCGCC